LGYSSSSKAYRVFNKRTLIAEESIHVTFDETLLQEVGKETSGFGVSRIITKDLVEDGIPQEASSKKCGHHE
jgi:hypothetical protein